MESSPFSGVASAWGRKGVVVVMGVVPHRDDEITIHHF
ncbi:protein of unknown function [Azospirillum baldaniorum]|uniref:Uncharacterized protein n=1 Tax=Azospirillum baldaniorum TaxID=1064539 RepID=A0A9P1JRV9_9PROT|nr:protein of unknown function [Azospirillum baldaniorum]